MTEFIYDPQEAIKKLKEIQQKYAGDNELIHKHTDKIIMNFLPDEVLDIYQDLERRYFWYS